jgi:hypothetical protein
MPQASPLIRLPEARPARWALLLELIATWYRPVASGDGYEGAALTSCQPRKGISLPLAMREWYGAAGRRDDIWGRQDVLIRPDKLALAGGVLEFYAENQGVTSWGVREAEVSLDDPPVVVRDEDDMWVVQSPQFSEFVLHMFTHAIQFGQHPAQIHGYAHPQCVQRLEAGLPRFGFPEFIWTRSRLFGFNDLVVSIDGTDHVSASARSLKSIEPFRQLIREEDFEIIAETADATTGRC